MSDDSGRRAIRSAPKMSAGTPDRTRSWWGGGTPSEWGIELLSAARHRERGALPDGRLGTPHLVDVSFPVDVCGEHGSKESSRAETERGDARVGETGASDTAERLNRRMVSFFSLFFWGPEGDPRGREGGGSPSGKWQRVCCSDGSECAAVMTAGVLW